jgi:hypothetical protein
MRLKTRLRDIERKLHLKDKQPRLVIVLEDEDGRWHDGSGNTIDPASVGPWVKVIRLIKRLDGPQ